MGSPMALVMVGSPMASVMGGLMVGPMTLVMVGPIFWISRRRMRQDAGHRVGGPDRVGEDPMLGGCYTSRPRQPKLLTARRAGRANEPLHC